MTANEFELLLETHNITDIAQVSKDAIEVTIADKLNEENIRKIILNTRMVWVNQWYESIVNEGL